MSKLPNVTTSIFTVMSKMASEYNAINLSQGFPNFPVDERLTDIVARLSKENVHQYTPMAGYPPLMNKIARLTFDSYNRTINPELELLVTAGATQGIFTTILALVKENDEVIILDPSYDCYEAPILLSNAKPIRVALNIDFTPNWETINQSVTENTKLIIINNPHNPTGKIWTNDDFEQLEKLISAFPPPQTYSESPFGVGGSGHGAVSAETIKGLPEGAELGPHGIMVFHDYEDGVAYAKEIKKPIMLDFTGYACVNCRKMENNVLSDPTVLPILKNDVVLISLYVDDKRALRCILLRKVLSSLRVLG